MHVVTVNEYLAQRDADWMGPIYRFLGLTVGVIKNQQDPTEKRAAYRCDITYGTNNEFGFDYLRDNLAFSLDDHVQRGLAFAIVDEVDSILIDEARTPLIISGPAEENDELYMRVNKLVPRLKKQKRRGRARAASSSPATTRSTKSRSRRTSPRPATSTSSSSCSSRACCAKARVSTTRPTSASCIT